MIYKDTLSRSLHRKEYMREYSRKWYLANRERENIKRKEHHKTPRGVLSIYKCNAKYRRDGRIVPFEIDDEYALSLLNSSCVYYSEDDKCSNKDGTTSDIRVGLDRVDNTKGYIEGNVAPCCWKHNSAKHAMGVPQMRKVIAIIDSGGYL